MADKGREKSDTMKRTGEDTDTSNLSTEEPPSERKLGSRSHTFITFSAGGGGVDGGGGDAGVGGAGEGSADGVGDGADHLLCKRHCYFFLII